MNKHGYSYILKNDAGTCTEVCPHGNKGGSTEKYENNRREQEDIHIIVKFVTGQLPRRTIPHRTGFGPDEWFYSVVVVLVGSCHDEE